MLDLLNLLKNYPGVTVSFRHDLDYLGGWQAKVEKTIPSETPGYKPTLCKKVVPFNENKLEDLQPEKAEAFVTLKLTQALEEVYAVLRGEEE
jgi:hypothetical protein